MNGTGIEGHLCAETVPSVADIPTDTRAFDLWVSDHWHLWPEHLVALAERLHQSMLTSDHASEAWRHSPATREANAADWSAFTTAYAEHRRAQS